MNDAKPFKSGLDEPRAELEFIGKDKNAELVDIASLMVEDRPTFADEMDGVSVDVSPEKQRWNHSNDDVLAQMMGGGRDEKPQRQKREEERPDLLQQQRQDIDEGNFF